MEGYGPSTYGDRFADVYDDWYGDRDDIDVVVTRLAALAGAGPALELGIGTGRLALPLAARGVEVWGVDASTAMVDRLRAKPGGDQVRVAIGDMADLDLAPVDPGGSARFSLVFVAANTFFNLVDAAAQQRCLTRVRAVLRDDGRFACEAFVPAVDAARGSIDVRTLTTDRVVLTITRHDPGAQTASGQHVELSESGIRLRPWVIRYAAPAELDRMAEHAGLRLVERWADWSGRPFTEQDSTHVSVYAPSR